MLYLSRDPFLAWETNILSNTGTDLVLVPIYRIQRKRERKALFFRLQMIINC
jgi:hypothetical protein